MQPRHLHALSFTLRVFRRGLQARQGLIEIQQSGFRSRSLQPRVCIRLVHFQSRVQLRHRRCVLAFVSEKQRQQLMIRRRGLRRGGFRFQKRAQRLSRAFRQPRVQEALEDRASLRPLSQQLMVFARPGRHRLLSRSHNLKQTQEKDRPAFFHRQPLYPKPTASDKKEAHMPLASLRVF